MINKLIQYSKQNIIINFVKYSIYIKDYMKYKKLNKLNSRFKLNWKNRQPQIHEKTLKTSFDNHYTYFPIWALTKIFKNKPKKHIDISSSIAVSTFSSIFTQTEFYDLRPAKIQLSNLKSKKMNILNLTFKKNSIQSLSCLHVLEHIGLGRYGDEINPKGDILAAKQLSKVLKPKGSLLIVVPVGKNTIKFNAHRIYSHESLLKLFPGLKLIEFSLIKDFGEGGIIKNASPEQASECTYGCGCFEFTK